MKINSLGATIFWAIGAFVLTTCLATTLMVIQGHQVSKDDVVIFSLCGVSVGLYLIFRNLVFKKLKRK